MRALVTGLALEPRDLEEKQTDFKGRISEQRSQMARSTCQRSRERPAAKMDSFSIQHFGFQLRQPIANVEDLAEYFLLDLLGFVDFLHLSFVLLAKARSVQMSFLEKIAEIFWEFSRSVLYWLLRELIIQRAFMTLKKKYRRSKGLGVSNI